MLSEAPRGSPGAPLRVVAVVVAVLVLDLETLSEDAVLLCGTLGVRVKPAANPDFFVAGLTWLLSPAGAVSVLGIPKWISSSSLVPLVPFASIVCDFVGARRRIPESTVAEAGSSAEVVISIGDPSASAAASAANTISRPM